MTKQSAGILLYRIHQQLPEFFLVHPGGPFWLKKDLHAWSIPKGEYAISEDPLSAAKREFEEETGQPPQGKFIELKPVTQKGGKMVRCFACEGEIDPQNLKSNTFEMEWPPRSGMKRTFPEIDRGEWFDAGNARMKLLESQLPFIDELLTKIQDSLKQYSGQGSGNI